MTVSYACLTHIVQGTVSEMLAAQQFKPHKVL